MKFTEKNIPHLRYAVSTPEATVYNVTTESIALIAIGVGIGIAAAAVCAGTSVSSYTISTKNPVIT